VRGHVRADPDDREEKRVRHPPLQRPPPHLDLTQIENKKTLAKNIFVFGQCMEGTQFYGLFGMVLSLYRQNKFPGIGQMFRYTLRDESNHIEVFRSLFMDLVDENPEIWTTEFREELVDTMREAVALEKEFIRDCLPVNAVGLSPEEFEQPTSTTSPTAASPVAACPPSTPASPILCLGWPK
jgi:ribonucleotide reductase beta subunit family protein with ferritin-like domain